jgi:hypothetical protein
MNADPSNALAEVITARIVAIDGVRGLFPSHPTAAAVLATIASNRPATARVGIDTRAGVIRVVARLATDRRTPSADVIAQVSRAVAELTGDRPLALHIEVAHID